MAESNARVPFAGGTGEPQGSPASGNYGFFEMRQAAKMAQNGVTPVTVQLYFPYAAGQFFAQIDSIVVDELSAFNSATSATLKIGTTPGGADIVTSVDVTGAGLSRAIYVPTSTQATKWQNIGTNTLYLTITPVGATTVGLVNVYIYYVVGSALQPVITF